MDVTADSSILSSQPSKSSAASINKNNANGIGRKMSVIEGIRKKAKRELEFQLHAFETKGRFIREDESNKKFVPVRRNVKLSADDEKELKKALFRERKARLEKQRLLNNNKKHKMNAEERFPEYPLENSLKNAKKDMKKVVQRKLKKLHRSVDLDFVRRCLPTYNGDLFGTNRSYLGGILYMSRMTAAQEHKSHNPWGDGERGEAESHTKNKVIEFLDDKRKVAKSLCNLSWHKSNSLNLINEGGLDVLLKMANLDDNEIRTYCALAIHNLTRYPDIQKQLFESYVVETLVMLSSTEGDAANVILSHCIAALCWLSAVPGYEALLVEQGALKVLDKLIAIQLGNELQLLVVKTLLNLTTCFDEQTSYAGVDYVINTCRDVMASTLLPTSAKMYAARALNNLALYENHRARMISEGMVRDLSEFHLQFAADPAVATPVVDGVESSIASTLNYLSACKGELKAAVIRQNAVQLLVKISKSKNNNTRQRCILALNNLAMDTHGDGRAAGQVLEPIIVLSDSKDSNTRLRCASALRSMSNRLGSRKYMMKKNIITVLNRMIANEINLMNGGDTWNLIIAHCTVTLCNLLVYEDTRSTCKQFQALDPDPLPAITPLFSSDDDEVVLDALILCSVMVNSTRMRRRLVDAGVVPIVQLCTHDNKELQMWAAAIIASLSFAPSCRKHLVDAGVTKGLNIVSNIKDDINLSRCSIAFCNLSAEENCRNHMIEEGVATSLIALASAHHESIRFNCCKALCNLSCEVSREIDLVKAGALPELMITALVRSEYPITKLICIKTIGNLIADDTITMLLEQGVAWAITAATTPEFAEDDEPLEDGLQLAGNMYCVIAKYEEGIQKIIDESGVLRSLAVLMKSKNPGTRSNAWEVLKAACQHPCQNRLMEENFLSTLKSMKVESSLHITQNIAALLSFLFRDKNIRRIIATDGIGVMKKIYHIDDEITTVQCMEALARLCCDRSTVKQVIKTKSLDMLHVLSLRPLKSTRSLCFKSLLHLVLFQEYLGEIVNCNVTHVVSQLVMNVKDNTDEELKMAVMTLNSLAWGHPHACVDGFGLVDLEGKVTKEERLHYKLFDGGIINTIVYIWNTMELDNIDVHTQRDIASIIANIVYHENSEYQLMLQQNILPILLMLAQIGDDFTKDLCFISLHNFALHKHAHITLIDGGVVEVLVEFLQTSKSKNLKQRQNIVATLCNLSSCLERGKFLVDCGVYDLTVVIGNTTDEFIRKCCGTILSSCSVHANDTKDGSVAALLDLCLPKTSNDTDDQSTMQSPNRGSGIHLASKKKIRKLHATVAPNIWSWEETYEYFTGNYKLDTKVQATLPINFVDEGEDEGSMEETVWVKEEAGSASGPSPQFPDIEPKDDKHIEEEIMKGQSGAESEKAAASAVSAKEKIAMDKQEVKLEHVKYHKVDPKLNSKWFDPVSAISKIGFDIDTAAGNSLDFDDMNSNEEYGDDDDFFEDDTDDQPLQNGTSSGASKNETKIGEMKEYERPSTSAKSSRERVNQSKLPSKSKVTFRENNTASSSSAVANSVISSQSRLPSSSVAEMMDIKRQTNLSSNNQTQQSEKNDDDSNVEDNFKDEKYGNVEEPIRLLGAESSREDVRTPSLNFVDNANYAGLWSDTPKIQWEDGDALSDSQMDIVLDEREKVQDTLHTFIVSVTAKDLGLELQEDVLGLDDGLYVRAVKNDGPLASSQILRGDQILMVAYLGFILKMVYW
eukprot:g2686.t1